MIITFNISFLLKKMSINVVSLIRKLHFYDLSYFSCVVNVCRLRYVEVWRAKCTMKCAQARGQCSYILTEARVTTTIIQSIAKQQEAIISVKSFLIVFVKI